MKKIKHLITVTILLITTINSFAQVGIGTITPLGALDITATNDGLVIPRVALTISTSALPLTAPTTSELVYNTATVADVTPGYYYWNATAWVRLGSGSVVETDPQVTSATNNTIPKWNGTTLVDGIVTDNGTSVGIGTATPLGALDITSTTDGVVIPRVALTITTSALPLTLPTTSELVYNTATAADVTPGYYYWNGVIWLRLATADNAWLTIGNSGLNASTNFLGTTDGVDVAFRRNNSAAGRIANTATSFGVGALTTGATSSNNAAFGNNAALSTTGARNVAVGTSSLQANTSGDENVAIGNQALLSNTNSLRNTAMGHRAMATLSGSGNVDNVAIGWQAMGDAASGINNTFVGVLAGRNNTGGNSTAIGRRALGSSAGGTSSGIDNVAIGSQALSFNMGGQQNTAIGTEAMATTTSSSNSTAVGYAALRNFQGAQNTAVGYQAGLGTGASSTGTNNIFMGFQAGSRVTSGSSNVLIGNLAGDNTTTGSVNTFIGQNAGNLNTTGDFNIGIGPNAGNANTTASNNINIGFQTGNSNISSNNVNIGHQAGFLNTLGGNVNIGYQAGVAETTANKLYITNSNTTPATSLIYGEFSPALILRTNGTLQIGDPAGVNGYALPILRGTANQILRTDGVGGTSWVSTSSIETDPQVSSATSNSVPKWNGTALVDGVITDDGTNVGIGIAPSVGNKLDVAGNTKTTNFQMTTGATATYFLQSDATGNGSWAPIPVNTVKPIVSTGAAIGIYSVSLTEYTVRIFNGVSEVTLPNATTNTGKVYILIGSNGISAKILSTLGGIVYDDVTNTTIATIAGGERLMVQSDGTNWLVIGR